MLRARLVCWFTLLLLSAGGPLQAASNTTPVRRVDILISQSAVPYEESVKGFRKLLQDSGLALSVEVHQLKGDESRAHAAARTAADRKSSLLFAVGTLAVQAARREASSIPLVAGMILTAGELKNAGNATGVVLELPLETEMEWMRRLLPEIRTVGVLYSPALNQSRVSEAARVASQYGLVLQSRRIDSPRDLPSELERLASQADVLWGITDPVILNPQTAQPLLLFSFRNRIPFIGVSRSWVKAGALYALERDFNDIGMQCGELALRILRGETAGDIPPAAPRKLGYALNLKTARHMKIELSNALIRGATEVVE